MEANKFTISHSLSCNVLLALLLISFLLFVSDLQTTMASTTTLQESSNKTYKTFIKNQCNSTTFPKECYKTLSSYASTIKTDPLTLCNTSLLITLKTARKYYVLTASLTKGKQLSRIEKAIVKDCVYEIGDCIEELSKSMNAMKNLKGTKEEVQFQMANIQTWVSASITDEDTCTDGFDGRKVSSYVKKPITKFITSLTRLTSNTLALINSLNKS